MARALGVQLPGMTQSRAPLIVAIVLLLLPVLYVGSYFVLVRPGGVPAGAIVHQGVQVQMFSPDEHYVLLNAQSRILFWPLEQIDRKLRPGAWGPVWTLPNFDGFSPSSP